MKGKVSSVLILLSIVSASLAAVGIGRATVHESHPGQCYHEKTNSYHSPGESWPLEGCAQATCERYSSSNPQLMISFESCGVAAVAPPCYLVEDNSKAYPDCCNQVVCPESSEDDDLFRISSAEWEAARNARNNVSQSDESSSSSSSSSVNDLGGTAVHFSLGRNEKDMNNAIDRDERNDLDSLEDDDDNKSEESFEIIQPRLLPPRFQYALFDDDIGNGHEQRFNEVDAQEDYQLV